MPDTPPPPLPDTSAPQRPEGGPATRLASSVSSTSFGRDPEGAGVPYAGVRLGLLLAALVALGFANPWMLIVVVAVLVMIALHELGHYLTAKRAGMKVTEFFLGFGPKIWSITRGETEYGIKLIPAGAYVKIPGMVNIDEVAPEDEPRTYRQKTFWQRLSVAVAGSAMHFLLALVLIYVAIVFVGGPNGSVADAAVDRAPVVEEVAPGSGAEAAGLQPDDVLISVNGNPTPTTTALREAVAPVRGETVSVVVERDGQRIEKDLSIQAYASEGERLCGLGISMQRAEVETVGPFEGLVKAPQEFFDVVALSAKGLAAFFSPSGIADFASQVGSAQDDRAASQDETAPADPEEDPCANKTVAGAVSSGSSSGENRVLSIYGLVQFGSDVGGVDPGALIGLFALINIFIGMFNLIPLLPFDGGHVAIAVYEKIQERRLNRRRYFTDVARLLPLTYGVVILLGTLFVTSLYLDIVNPIGG